MADAYFKALYCSGSFAVFVYMAVVQMGNKVCFKPPEREAKLIQVCL
jgi:hypothetical protein